MDNRTYPLARSPLTLTYGTTRWSATTAPNAETMRMNYPPRPPVDVRTAICSPALSLSRSVQTFRTFPKPIFHRGKERKKKKKENGGVIKWPYEKKEEACACPTWKRKKKT